jgi:nitrogen fixation protein FixH
MTSIDLPRPAQPARRPLTGFKVLIMLVAFFGTVAAVNGLMIHYALSTFPGVEDDRAYEHGLAYNNDISAAQHQNQLGWKVDGRFTRELGGMASLIITMKDPQGVPQTGLAISAQLEFMPDGRRDLVMALTETSAGEYRGEIKAEPGSWLLDLSASKGGETLYRTKNRLTLQ